jgi:hypothetical protein
VTFGWVTVAEDAGSRDDVGGDLMFEGISFMEIVVVDKTNRLYSLGRVF